MRLTGLFVLLSGMAWAQFPECNPPYSAPRPPALTAKRGVPSTCGLYYFDFINPRVEGFIKFLAPHGHPPGESVSMRVYYEPTGDTPTEREANLTSLKRYRVSWGDQVQGLDRG